MGKREQEQDDASCGSGMTYENAHRVKQERFLARPKNTRMKTRIRRCGIAALSLRTQVPAPESGRCPMGPSIAQRVRNCVTSRFLISSAWSSAHQRVALNPPHCTPSHFCGCSAPTTTAWRSPFESSAICLATHRAQQSHALHPVWRSPTDATFGPASVCHDWGDCHCRRTVSSHVHFGCNTYIENFASKPLRPHLKSALCCFFVTASRPEEARRSVPAPRRDLSCGPTCDVGLLHADRQELSK